MDIEGLDNAILQNATLSALRPRPRYILYESAFDSGETAAAATVAHLETQGYRVARQVSGRDMLGPKECHTGHDTLVKLHHGHAGRGVA